ncbi:hypothetical protein BOTBODRAFT_160330 [Botryobasidium botryosum FD-172 SS1]|uniref:phosphoinositide 5-phosphatase n=1 Tax=Botryobasidium botryosum (strain FD-172 SS1) TaxID=930990 RepID=A0A067MPC1_BOTB1|nr:hypothetical protein BOTBODRAFT_160330 [Botryobasidium botryosum FD-172 SS1]
MHLYLRGSPRALILVTSSDDERKACPPRALVLRPAEGKTSSQAVIESLPKDQVDLSSAVRLTSKEVYGCLGLINIANDIFLAVVTAVSLIGNLRPGASYPSQHISRILEVSFYGLNTNTYDDLPVDGAAARFAHSNQTGAIPKEQYVQQPAQPPISDHPCAPLVKILAAGTFYYTPTPQWDLSTRLGKDGEASKDISYFDGRFVWNEFIVRSLLDFREGLDEKEREELDMCQFIILATQGYVGLFTIPLPVSPSRGAPEIGTLALISRLGWKRAGTRFNTRGVDDDGNCANFVETETIFSTQEISYSYVQIRGSIPLFWEQQGLQTFGHRIQITRPQLASQPAFERHMTQLLDEYAAVHVVNLLGVKENEQILSGAYSQHLRAMLASGHENIWMTNFDFHNAVRTGGHDSTMGIKRTPGVRTNIDNFGFTAIDLRTGQIVAEQRGVFRTNCLDCLDSTNFVQDILSRATLEQYLFNTYLGVTSWERLWSYHGELWAENGDALSRIYAGTGALNTGFTRSGKRTWGGLLSDMTKSVSRAYINNFQDKGKQSAIDMFLGNFMNQKIVTIYDPIHDFVRSALAKRLPEYSTTRKCSIFVGTWNLNGRSPSESLIPWLFPLTSNSEPDMMVLGFQEIVPPTAQQIMQTDPEKLRTWETVIMTTLAKRPNKTAEYLILRSEQLVGTALILLVKSELTGVIRNVEATTRKTGLRGMSGDKGAVGIRLEYYDTSFCFITAHLAAGHTNVEERNDDYHTIVNGLSFQRGKTIGSHDCVIWAADTNYCINLENEQVRALAMQNDLDSLLAADQLREAMDSQVAFIGYEEGVVLFRPTYPYNLFSDEYDTSEKMRIPAWTDRVLYRGESLKLVMYSRAELGGSNHRPVYALFHAQVRKVDVAKRTALSQQLLKSVMSSITTHEKQDEQLTFSNVNLPPPSLEEPAWRDGPVSYAMQNESVELLKLLIKPLLVRRFKKDILRFMAGLRNDLMSPTLARDIRQRKLEILQIIYSRTGVFPGSPDLQEYEVKRLSISGQGGFGECYRGTFLGEFDVALKCLRTPADKTARSAKRMKKRF